MNTQYMHKWIDCNLNHYKQLLKGFPTAKELSKLLDEHSVINMSVKRERTPQGLKSTVRLDTIDGETLKAIYLPLNIK